MSRPEQFAKLLSGTKPIISVGAHNGLSAKLVEEAGFDTVWAGGLEISTAMCVPDANILSMAENLAVVRNITESVKIPVIVDSDNGYGNAINVMRMIEQYESVGVAGVCIEDNVFPKRNSFYVGVKRELEPINEFVGKLRAARKAKSSDQFAIIARTEALIAGMGLDEALNRATAYSEAGADMILVHSKAKDASEVKAFSEIWKGSTPLVSVPTTYSGASVKDLHTLGYKMIIFANIAIRTSIMSMANSFSALKSSERLMQLEDSMVPLGRLFDIVGLDVLKTNEQMFLSTNDQKRTAVILAAGFDKRMMPLVHQLPKCMLQVKGKPILERQIELLKNSGISDIVIVRGYMGDKIRYPNIRYYENASFANTHMVSSLFSAENEMDDEFVMIYSDILFDQSVLEKLLKAQGDICVVVDHAWRERPRETGIPSEKTLDLVTTSKQFDRSRFLDLDEENHVLTMAKGIDRKLAHGEFIGMAKFSKKGAQVTKEVYHEVLEKYKDKPFHESSSIQMASFPDLIQELIARGIEVRSVDIFKGWMEVDDLYDYGMASARTDSV
ncbi:MAG: phosphoenolpyruvate mutase [Thaumarchaeota archaeon]|nr:phosphoenolpyruvate mutase [Nitrososphaerota archaeon]